MSRHSTQAYGGSAAAMRDSEWLASEDIDIGKDVVVTVSQVFEHRNVEFEGGRKKPLVYSLGLVGKQRKLVLNATNRKQLVQLHGPLTRNWEGKAIALYVDHNVRLAGKTVKGIRIRPTIPQPPQSQQPPQQSPPQNQPPQQPQPDLMAEGGFEPEIEGSSEY